MKLTIGAEPFGSKAAAAARCREILGRHIGEQIPAGRDRDFVEALLDRHPDADEKIGCGIAKFRSVLEPAMLGKKGTWHFEAIRNDGTVVDFSFYKCLSGTSRRIEALSAMRHAVAEQLADARHSAATEGGELHAHHAGSSFLTLANAWLKASGKTYMDLAIAPAVDGIGTVMTAPQERKTWEEYHRRHATLVPMDAHEHLRLPKGAREKAPDEKEVR